MQPMHDHRCCCMRGLGFISSTAVSLVSRSCCQDLTSATGAACPSLPSPGQSQACRSSLMSRRGSKASAADDAIMTGESAWLQKTITLKAPSRGCHLITHDVLAELPELSKFTCGTAHFFIQHTSASLSINENADPTVRSDLEKALNKIVPESWNRDTFSHTMEGDDDMPGHVKSTLVGSGVTVPISGGRLNLGTWQGLYLLEHRNTGGWGGGHSRKIVITIHGLLSPS